MTGVSMTRRQSGFAMIALITLITMISAYYIAQAVSRSTTEVNTERNRRSGASLLEAKAALITWAATGNLQFNGVSVQPGGLPCPDTDDDGNENYPCSSADSRIGRLPWKTIGASDLRDASGQRLWYALSDSFRKRACTSISPRSPVDCTIINFDTQGQLSISGSAPMSNVIAIVFAPGEPLGGQSRNRADSTAWNNRANFLEGENADSGPNDDVFASVDIPTNAFNDRLVAIGANDLWPAVEGVVAAKLQENDGAGGKPWLAAYIEQYRTTWGRYPFAATFDPVNSNFRGTQGVTEGLLPLTSDPTFITWKTSGPQPTIAAAPGSPGTVDVSQAYTNCSTSTATQLECKANWCGSSPNLARVRITATANNPGMTFARSFIMADMTSVDRSTSSPNLNINWSDTRLTVTIFASSYALASDGTGTVSIDFRLPSKSCSSQRTIRIRIPVLPYHSITSPTDAFTGWFVANQWYKHAYFAVSPGYAPSYAPAPGTCTPGGTPACLTVNSLSPSNNKLALLVFAGRTLPGKTRPSSTLGNYFEGENASSGNRIYDSPLPPSPALNDRVMVVSP